MCICVLCVGNFHIIESLWKSPRGYFHAFPNLTQTADFDYEMSNAAFLILMQLVSICPPGFTSSTAKCLNSSTHHGDIIFFPRAELPLELGSSLVDQTMVLEATSGKQMQKIQLSRSGQSFRNVCGAGYSKIFKGQLCKIFASHKTEQA